MLALSDNFLKSAPFFGGTRSPVGDFQHQICRSVFEVIAPIICSTQTNMKAMDNSTQVVIVIQRFYSANASHNYIQYGITPLIID